MSGESKQDRPEVIFDGADVPSAMPGTPKRLQLDTVRAARREMARVYGLVARGQISTKRGAQAVYMLQVIAKTIEVEKIEPALEALERGRALLNR